MALIESAQLHHAPGKGPWHVKGLVYAGALAHYDARVPGGLGAVLERVDAPLVEFLNQKFVVGGWYDVGPLTLVGQAAALVANVPHLEFLRDMARTQAERDIQGVYRILLKVASPEMVVRRLPQAANKYFDFVQAEVREVRPKCWESTGHGIPSIASTAYMAVTEAFVSKALQLAGARELRHRWFAPEQEGALGEVALMKIRRELSWQ